MAIDIDQLPINESLFNQNSTFLSDRWRTSLATFWQTLASYLTAGGIILPNLTTMQRDSLVSPQNSQLIYNITVDAPQFYQSSSGEWRTISFT